MKKEEATAREYYDGTANGYLTKWSELETSPFKNATNYFRNRMIDTIFELGEFSADNKIIELGCGTCINLLRFHPMYGFVYGLDISLEMMRSGLDYTHASHKEAPHLLLIQGDCANLPIKADSFDVVISVEVVRYLPDWMQYLENVRTVLKPGGQFIFTSENIFAMNLFPMKRTILQKLRKSLDGDMFQYFSTAYFLKTLLRKTGFTNITIHRAFFWHASFSRLLKQADEEHNKTLFKRYEMVEKMLSSTPIVKELCNCFIVTCNA